MHAQFAVSTAFHPEKAFSRCSDRCQKKRPHTDNYTAWQCQCSVSLQVFSSCSDEGITPEADQPSWEHWGVRRNTGSWPPPGTCSGDRLADSEWPPTGPSRRPETGRCLPSAYCWNPLPWSWWRSRWHHLNRRLGKGRGCSSRRAARHCCWLPGGWRSRDVLAYLQTPHRESNAWDQLTAQQYLFRHSRLKIRDYFIISFEKLKRGWSHQSIHNNVF